MASYFEGAFLVEKSVNVGRLEVFDLQNAFVHHRNRYLRVASGFYFNDLLGFRPRFFDGSNFDGNFSIRIFHLHGRETVCHRERQIRII